MTAASAKSYLDSAAETLCQRGEKRDSDAGERSMHRIVSVFNALTGHRLTEAEGWKFMLCLKLARAEAGKFDPDDYVDLIGYAALLAEHLHGENCPLDEDRESRYLRTAERH